MSIQIIGLSGSLRRESYNTNLLHAAVKLMPAGSVLTVRTIHGIPLYNEDEEDANGVPPVVDELKTLVARADGLLLSTPEYNHSIPGVFKNAIDWLSRPGADIPRVFGGKPVALFGASPGGFGTVLSQNAWLPVLHTLGTRHWSEDQLMIPHAHQVFAAGGGFSEAAIEERLRAFLDGFVRFAGVLQRPAA